MTRVGLRSMEDLISRENTFSSPPQQSVSDLQPDSYEAVEGAVGGTRNLY